MKFSMGPVVRASKLLIFIAATIIAGCSKGIKKDDWHRPIPAMENEQVDWTKLHDEDIMLPEKLDFAINILGDNEIKMIDQSDFELMVSKKVILRDNRKFFLVRGLTYNKNWGKFSVYKKENSILVANNSLGKSGVKMLRAPIIIISDSIPKHIYITCSMAE